MPPKDTICQKCWILFFVGRGGGGGTISLLSVEFPHNTLDVTIKKHCTFSRREELESCVGKPTCQYIDSKISDLAVAISVIRGFVNSFNPKFLNWTLSSFNLDVSTVVNWGVSQNN